MTAKGEISTNYDIEAHPDADEFDPVAWWLATGEDLGLPEGWIEEHPELAAMVAKDTAEVADT